MSLGSGSGVVISLTRLDSKVPWGFRIHGGYDFRQPLVVLKVSGNSEASSKGLSPGDQILKINGQSVESLSHKEAEELIGKLPDRVDLEVIKGTVTWKPEVEVLDNPSSMISTGGSDKVLFTRTSLAHNHNTHQQEQQRNTNKINNMPRPFNAQGVKPGVGLGGAAPQLVNKQFNTPIKIYSEQSIAETLSAQAEVLAGGAIGVNFKKNEKKYNYEDSEVYKMLQEVERGGASENEQPSPGIVRIAAPSGHFGGGGGQFGGGGGYVGQGQQLIQQQVLRQQNQSAPQQAPQQQFKDPPMKTFEPVSIPPVNLKPVAQAQQVTAPVTAPVQQQGQQGNNPNVCADCERLIVGVFVRIKDKNLHVDCFKCSTCGQSLKNVGYYNINNKLYCDIHAKMVAKANPPAGIPQGMEPFTLPPGAAAGGGQASPSIIAPPPGFSSPGALAAGKPFSYTGGAGGGSPLIDSYASNVAPLPYHHSPVSGSAGISHVTAPKSPQHQQHQPSFQPVSATPPSFQPLGATPPQFQPLIATQPSFQPPQFQQQPSFQPLIQQQQQSYSESSYKKSSSSSFEQTVTSTGGAAGSAVTWPPIGIPPIGSGNVSQISPKMLADNSQPKFKQQQVPYKPLATLLQPAANRQQQQQPYAAPPTAQQQYSAPPQQQPSYQPVQQQQPSYQPVQQPSYQPVQQQQPAYSPIKAGPPISYQPLVPPPSSAGQPMKQQPSFTPAKPNVGPGAGGSSSSKTSQSIVANRISRGILTTQPSARQAVCGACHKQIRGPFITAGAKFYCPDHFKCGNESCKRELLEIGFVEEKGNLYCEFCWESHIAPLCSKCNKRIKYESLNAIGQHFHQECFKCTQCAKVFGTEAFFLEDGLPYCDRDWNELFTTKCHGCGFPIEAGDRWVEAMNQNYHSQCFNCSACKKNLEGQSFFAKAGRPFCKSHAR